MISYNIKCNAHFLKNDVRVSCTSYHCLVNHKCTHVKRAFFTNYIWYKIGLYKGIVIFVYNHNDTTISDKYVNEIYKQPFTFAC